MIKRNGKITTLLVAATAISTIIPTVANATVVNDNKTCIENKHEKNEECGNADRYNDNCNMIDDKNEVLDSDCTGDVEDCISDEETVEDDMLVDEDTTVEVPSIDKNNKIDISIQGQWIKNENGTWSFVKADGTLQTGWLNENGTSYYLNAKGEMQIGWVKADGNWYYLNINGSLAVNTTIDGLEVGADGALI